jgi:hypothetical protein
MANEPSNKGGIVPQNKDGLGITHEEHSDFPDQRYFINSNPVRGVVHYEN